jgi:hypothetical protein
MRGWCSVAPCRSRGEKWGGMRVGLVCGGGGNGGGGGAGHSMGLEGEEGSGMGRRRRARGPCRGCVPAMGRNKTGRARPGPK